MKVRERGAEIIFGEEWHSDHSSLAAAWVVLSLTWDLKQVEERGRGDRATLTEEDLQVVQEVAFPHLTPLPLPCFGLLMLMMRVRVLQIPHCQCL